MPTYDYRCDACDHEFEEWQSFTAEKLTKCPACKKNKLVRLFGSGAAIVFKGSGFYDTDYRQADEKAKSERKNGKPAEDGKDAPADAKAEPAGDAKTDAKTEAKADGKSDGKAEPKADAPKVEAAAPPKESPKESGKPKTKKGA